MIRLRRNHPSSWALGSFLAASLLLGAAAYFLSQRQEVWLAVPDSLTGSDVLADGVLVGRIEDPDLTYLSFWHRRRELELRHTAYHSVRLPLSGGQSYPVVSKADLIPAEPAAPFASATPPAPVSPPAEIAH
jgi:hypothetical protein